MELTEQELEVIRKDANAITYHDHRNLQSAYKKIITGNDKNLISVCTIRLAMAYDRSRIPHHEKAHFWEVAAIKAQEANKPCAIFYSNSGELLARDLAHGKSAKLFENAVNASSSEQLDQAAISHLYRECRRQYDLAGNTESASRVFILEKNYQLQHSKGFKKVFLYLYKILSAYGESPMRVALAGFSVISICALIYYFVGIYSSEKNEVIHSLTTSIYFSIVTFTTLGYGDYSPVNTFARATSACEAILGLLITSLFLVTVVRKYSR